MKVQSILVDLSQQIISKEVRLELEKSYFNRSGPTLNAIGKGIFT